MNRVRVLIVDDSLTIRAMMASVLENDEALQIVGVAANADEAHAMIARKPPDVVTLDIEMPGINGLAFLKDLMASSPLPVVMVSSRAPKGAAVRAEALALGAVACFDKADLLREAKRFVKLVKDAARGKVKPEPPEAEAEPPKAPPPEGEG